MYNMDSTDRTFINRVYQRCLNHNSSLMNKQIFHFGDDAARNSSGFINIFCEGVQKRIAVMNDGRFLPKVDPDNTELINFVSYFAIGIVKYTRKQFHIVLRIEKIGKDKVIMFMPSHVKEGIISAYAVFEDSQGLLLSRILYLPQKAAYVNIVQKAITKTSRRGV